MQGANQESACIENGLVVHRALDHGFVGDFDELVHKLISLINLRQFRVLLEIVGVPLLISTLLVRINLFDQTQRLRSHHPVELSCVLESFLRDSVVGQEFNNSQRQIRPFCLFIRLLSFFKFVVCTEEISIGQPHQGLKVRVMFR